MKALERRLKGDLDRITMKAMEKDRIRRYETPNAFALDVRRHLDHEPIRARAPSPFYRAGRFVRRHRLGVAVAFASVVFLAVFVISLASERNAAERAREEAERERDRANQETEAKTQVSEFLKDLFTVSDPAEVRGNSVTARELLDQGAEKIEGMLTEQPETRAELMATMGDVYLKLGLYAQAQPLYLETLETRKRVLGDDHPTTLTSMNNLAILYWKQGRHDEAELLFLETLETRKRVLGDEHPRTASSLYNLACLEALRGQRSKAMDWLRQSVEAGYAKADSMAEGTPLETLHGPEFDTLVERARKNAAAQRAK